MDDEVASASDGAASAKPSQRSKRQVCISVLLQLAPFTYKLSYALFNDLDTASSTRHKFNIAQYLQHT